jgi:hypothetical protein
MNSRRLIRSPRRGPQVIIDARRYRLLPALPTKKDGTPGTFAAQRNFDPTCDRFGSWPCENFSGRATRRNISEQLHLWESNHTARASLDALLENCVFYISRMYEFLHSQGQSRPRPLRLPQLLMSASPRLADVNSEYCRTSRSAMCGRLRVGKAFLHVWRLVGAAMCSAFSCGSHDRWP